MNSTRSAFLFGMSFMYWAPLVAGIILTALWGPWVALLMGVVVYAVTFGRAALRR